MCKFIVLVTSVESKGPKAREKWQAGINVSEGEVREILSDVCNVTNERRSEKGVHIRRHILKASVLVAAREREMNARQRNHFSCGTARLLFALREKHPPLPSIRHSLTRKEAAALAEKASIA